MLTIQLISDSAIFRIAADSFQLSCIFSLSLATPDEELLLDYSKNIITEETMKLLLDLVGVHTGGSHSNNFWGGVGH